MPKRLLLLNGLAIIGVILFHAEGWTFTAMFDWASRYLPETASADQGYGSIAYFGLRSIEQLVVYSITSFLFVSGYFVAFTAGRSRTSVDGKILGARIKSLIIPYLFWSALVGLALWLEGRRPGKLAGYAEWLLTGSVNPAYYYVPLLIQFYLLSPLIVRLARSNWKLLLIVTGLLQFLVHLVHYPDLLQSTWPGWSLAASLLPRWLFLTRIFWFCFGVVFGFQLPAFKRAFERTKWLALASLVCLFALGIVEWEVLVRLTGKPALQMQETVVDALYAGAFIWTFLGFSDLRLPAAPAVSGLGGKSFGIYLVHSPAMEYFSRALYHLAPQVLAYPSVLLPALIFVGLAVPLVLMQLVSRSPARGLYAYQFG